MLTQTLLMSWCHGGVGIAIHPDMGIMRVRNTVPCQSCCISKQDVSYKKCVYNAFSENPRAKHHPCTTWSDSSWGILQTRGTPIPSAAAIPRTLVPRLPPLFSKTRPYVSRHRFLGIADWEFPVNLSEYCSPLKPVTFFNAPCNKFLNVYSCSIDPECLQFFKKPEVPLLCSQRAYHRALSGASWI
jgi:hypothetical protein